MRMLIIIPAYNESQNIKSVWEEVRKNRPDADVVVINDGSADETEQVCKENGISCISLPFNLGIGGAVQTGYLFAQKNGYDIAVQFDGDGQHDIKWLDAITAPVQNGEADLCVGSRFIREEKDIRPTLLGQAKQEKGFRSTFMRRVGIHFFTGLIRLITKNKITDPTSGFRAAGADAIAFFARNYPSDYPEPESIVTAFHNHLRVAEAPVRMHERRAGQSSIDSWKAVYYMMKVSIAILMCGKKQTANRQTL